MGGWQLGGWGVGGIETKASPYILLLVRYTMICEYKDYYTIIVLMVCAVRIRIDRKRRNILLKLGQLETRFNKLMQCSVHKAEWFLVVISVTKYAYLSDFSLYNNLLTYI